MTDLEAFKELYRRFGIECIKVPEEGGKTSITLIEFDPGDSLLGDPYEKYYTMSEKFNGYPGFYSCIVFSKEGKFEEQSFLE